MTPIKEYEFAYKTFKDNEPGAAYPLAIGIIKANIELESKKKAFDNIRAVISALSDFNDEILNEIRMDAFQNSIKPN